MLSQREIRFLDESNALEGMPQLVYLPASTKGHAKAWAEISEASAEKRVLGLTDICRAQELLMEEQADAGLRVPEKGVGVIRSSENRIQVRFGPYFGTHYQDVPVVMGGFMTKLGEYIQSQDEDPIAAAARFHREFIGIHPFADGNGRVGRMLANYVVASSDSPILIFPATDKQAYITARNTSDEASIQFFKNQVGRFVPCITGCGDEVVERVEKGVETDLYECGNCGTDFALDRD